MKKKLLIMATAMLLVACGGNAPTSSTPKSNGGTSTPVSDTPTSVTPSSETPTSTTPSSETPTSTTPSSETPTSTTPSSETPTSTTPSSTTPSVTPSTVTPTIEDPVVDSDAAHAVNISGIDNGTYSEDFIKGIFSFHVTSTKTVIVEENGKNVDGVKYTKKLKLGGNMDKTGTSRTVEFTATRAATLYVVAISSSGSEERSLAVYPKEKIADFVSPKSTGTAPYLVSDSSVAGQMSFNGTTAEKKSVHLDPGTYVLGSTYNGVNLYDLQLVYDDSSSETMHDAVDNQKVQFEGWVTSVNSEKTFTVENASGAAYVYKATEDVAVGDYVRVNGEAKLFKGLVEVIPSTVTKLESPLVTEEDGATPSIYQGINYVDIVAQSDGGKSSVSRLAILKGAIIKTLPTDYSRGGSVIVTVGEKDYTVRIDSKTNLETLSAFMGTKAVGDSIDVDGYVGWFNEIQLTALSISTTPVEA